MACVPRRLHSDFLKHHLQEQEDDNPLATHNNVLWFIPAEVILLLSLTSTPECNSLQPESNRNYSPFVCLKNSNSRKRILLQHLHWQRPSCEIRSPLRWDIYRIIIYLTEQLETQPRTKTVYIGLEGTEVLTWIRWTRFFVECASGIGWNRWSTCACIHHRQRHSNSSQPVIQS